TISVASGQVTFSGTSMIIDPTADLLANTAYQVLIGAGVVTDTSGNAFAGLVAGDLDFTTSVAGTLIPTGSFATAYSITTAGPYTLAAGGTRTATGSTGIQATVGSGITNIDIEGTLNDTSSGARALRAGVPAGTITVGAAGIINSLDGDDVQAQTAT